MTKLIHTADVHLRPDTRERYEALQAVIDTAITRDVDVLTIGGDLFDRPEDVETLRGDLRTDLFSDLPFEILLIPGNHDIDAFRGDLFFGDACTVMAEPQAQFATWASTDNSLRIVGIPYQETVTDELLLALSQREPFDGTDVLLFHGSVDAPINGDAGEEAAHRYFPITQDQLADLQFDFYLAGHYHTAHKLHFETGSEFAYPGTPASTRTSETGRRRVVSLDPDEGLDFELIDSHHYLEKHVTVTPGEEDAVCDEIESWVETTVTTMAECSVTVDGFVEMRESRFDTKLQRAATPVSVTNMTRSIDHILDHPVIREFKERLSERDWNEETKAAVWQRTLSAATAIESSGGLS